MPKLKPEEIRKVHWTISEVAALAGVATSAIRFWESEMPWIKPEFKTSGYKRVRYYNERTMKGVLTVSFLLNAGMTVAGLKRAKEHDYLDELFLFFLDKDMKIKEKE